MILYNVVLHLFQSHVFLKRYLYNFNYPNICHDKYYVNADKNITEFGKKLKNFENITNFFIQIFELQYFNKILHTNYTYEQILKHFSTYESLLLYQGKHIIKSQSNYFNKLYPILTLTINNNNVWGCKRQYLYGYICSKIFEHNNIIISPILNHTGGICGPGNHCIYTGSINNYITIHSCIHDASGYCYNYHNIGYGYNYLNIFSTFPSYSPYSCQFIGLIYCYMYKYIINNYYYNLLHY